MKKQIITIFLPIADIKRLDRDIDDEVAKAFRNDYRLKSTEVLPLGGKDGPHQFSSTLLLIFEYFGQ